MLPSPPLWPALPALPALPWPLQGKLQLLCMQLDRHINTCIRESPQAMHWTTLKDLAAQTHTRWQELLAQCQPQVAPHPPTPRLGGGVASRLTRARRAPTHSAAARLLAGRWERAVGGCGEMHPWWTIICLIKGQMPRVGCSEGDTDKLTPG